MTIRRLCIFTGSTRGTDPALVESAEGIGRGLGWGARSLVLTLAFTTALGACGMSGDAKAKNPLADNSVMPRDATLGDAQFAFFVGPQFDEMVSNLGQERWPPGYVVLVDADGSHRPIRTARMDMMRPAWAGAGLAFGDEKADVVVARHKASVRPSPKDPAQNMMFAMPDGRFIGVYRAAPEGSDVLSSNRIVESGEGARGPYELPLNAFTGARCGKRIFGLVEEGAADADEGATERLVLMYPGQEGTSPREIGSRRVASGGTSGFEVECPDSVMTYLSRQPTADGRGKPVIVSWDVDSGAVTEKPLQSTSGEALGFDLAPSSSWRKGRLEWVHQDGWVYRTDPETGRSERAFDTGLPEDESQESWAMFTFSDRYLHILRAASYNTGHLEYRRLNRADGKPVQTIETKVPSGSVNVADLNLSALVVPPDR